MQDYRSALNIAGWVFTFFSTAFICARMNVRLVLNKGMAGWDDWLMLLAYGLTIVCTCLVTVGTTYGFGLHIHAISDPIRASEAIKYVLIAPVFSLIAAIFTKLSIIIAFMRIMGRTMTWTHRLIAYVPVVILIGANIFACAVIIFYCSPVQKSWNPTLPGTCLDPNVLDLGGRIVAAYNAAMDVFCAIVPFFLIRRLTLKRREKRNLIILMGGGVFGAFATIMKIVNMSNIKDVADLTYTWAPITIWYLAENHVLIMAGSMPALRSFWRVLYGKYSTGRSTSNDQGESTNNGRKRSTSIHLSSLGVSSKKQKPKEGIYTMALRDSEDERGGSGSQHRTQKDNSSIESILPKHAGFRAQITSGLQGPSHSHQHQTRVSKETGSVCTNDGIHVVKEVSQQYHPLGD